MKTKTIMLFAVILAAVAFSGCASQPIEAASTRLKVSNVTGKSVEIALPKNLDATDLMIVVDPASGKYQLSAKKLVTDASTVIDSAAAAQSRALELLSGSISQILPLLTPVRPPGPAQ